MKKVKSRRAPAKTTRQKAAIDAKPTGKRSRKTGKGGAGQAADRHARAGKSPTRSGAKTATAAKAKKDAKPALRIRELDPLRVCGGRTSVVQLFRVEEQLIDAKPAGARQVHLVFNDRHGWYCEHGRSCHAVSAVMRHAGIR
ncbi:MAG: hypothetical protein ACJ79K_01520 [Gemmatimonadaceae bacterium]